MRHSVSIEIAGVCPSGSSTPWRWWAEAPLNTTSTDRVHALLSIGPFGASVPEGDTVAQSSVTSIVLAADDHTGYGTRPIDIFSRVGAENLQPSEVWQTTGMAAGDTAIPLKVVTGSVAIPADTYLHVGTEMIKLTAAWAATADADVACSRGEGGTLAKPHRADLSGYFARTIPVTLYPTEWIGRQVTVYVDGEIWRVGMLVDNPLITKGQITLSYVSIENLLSVDKSGDYVPPNGTTLAPTPASSWVKPWSIWVNWPERQLPIPRSAVDTVVSLADALSDETEWEFSGGTLYGYTTPQRIDAFAFWPDQYTCGIGGMPAVYVTMSRAPYTIASGDTGELSYELQIDFCNYGGGSAICWVWVETDNWLTMAEATSTGDVWYPSRLRSPSFCNPILETVQYAAAGERSASPNDYPYGDVNEWVLNPFDFELQQHCVSVWSHVTPTRGYPLKDQPYYVGVLSRRNLRRGEEAPPNEQMFGSDPIGVIQPDDWSEVTGPCPPWYQCPKYDFYPVRPSADGGVHRVVTDRGCCLTMDMWVVQPNMANFDLPCDVASAYWETGMQYIMLLATIPGITTDGEYGYVTITWEEPDGEVMEASANVCRRTSQDDPPYYCYEIDAVTTKDGKRCAGFGSWPGHQPVMITPPTYAHGTLGTILGKIIASSDSTSGRVWDECADGLGCPLTTTGVNSLSLITAGELPEHWYFDPSLVGYREYITAATMLSGTMLVGRASRQPGGQMGYGPEAVPAGRPSVWEVVDSWTDADIIGLPTSSGDRGLTYTGYKITADTRVVSMADWLAADQLGQGESCEIDITSIYTKPKQVTEETLQTILGGLHDRFGVPRRRWTLSVPIDIGLHRSVGDVVSITSEYLVSATGQVGVTNAMGRIHSITHDLVGGKCDVELLSYADYGAGYSHSWEMTVTAVSGTSYTMTFDLSADPIKRARQVYDLSNFAPEKINDSSAKYIYVAAGIRGNNSSGYMQGYFTSWTIAPDGLSGTVVMSRTNYVSPAPTTGTRVLVVKATQTDAVIPDNLADAFALGGSLLL